jgi:hypothetical protein
MQLLKILSPDGQCIGNSWDWKFSCIVQRVVRLYREGLHFAQGVSDTFLRIAHRAFKTI